MEEDQLLARRREVVPATLRQAVDVELPGILRRTASEVRMPRLETTVEGVDDDIDPRLPVLVENPVRRERTPTDVALHRVRLGRRDDDAVGESGEHHERRATALSRPPLDAEALEVGAARRREQPREIGARRDRAKLGVR